MPKQSNYIPLPGECFIDLTHPESSRISWRSLGIVLSRVAALPNMTDSFLSQAQFNTLAAEFAPRNLRPMAMVAFLPAILAHLAFTETLSEDGQSEISQPSGGLCVLPKALNTLIPKPENFGDKELAKLTELFHATTATALNQLSQRSFSCPTLPMRTTIKPKSPEIAALDWAEAMETACANLKHRTAA